MFSPEAKEDLEKKTTHEEVEIASSKGSKVVMNIDRHGDLSTFATVQEKKQGIYPVEKEGEDLRDDVSAVTTGSYETRITSVEQKMDQMQSTFETKMESTTEQINDSLERFMDQLTKKGKKQKIKKKEKI